MIGETFEEAMLVLAEQIGLDPTPRTLHENVFKFKLSGNEVYYAHY